MLSDVPGRAAPPLFDPAKIADKYPLWTLEITRKHGPYLNGVCGCGWESGLRLRTVTVAEAWDEHVLHSAPEIHQDSSGYARFKTLTTARRRWPAWAATGVAILIVIGLVMWLSAGSPASRPYPNPTLTPPIGDTL